MDAFAEIASLPILTYDSMDVESNRCLGAAIWMLDQIGEEHEMQSNRSVKVRRLLFLHLVWYTRSSKSMLWRRKWATKKCTQCHLPKYILCW